MHIVLDATAVPVDRGGVGRYVDGLVAALVSTGVQVTVVAHPRDKSTFETLGAAVCLAPRLVAKAPFRMLWEQLCLPTRARRLRGDVLHCPHYSYPLLRRAPLIVTIHDLTFFSTPEVHTRLKRIYFRWWMRRLARKRVPVVSVSEATASEFVEWTGADPSTITVTGLGVDKEFFRPPTVAEREACATRYGVTDWIAFLATLEPRKNAVSLIDAYAVLVEQRGAASLPALLLAGGRGWDTGVDPAIARAVARGADVRRIGYLSVADLRGFLGGSTVFAYPSLGEGFGLPVLEAMACGAAVLTTRELSLPEVGGDAVAYCETDADSIRLALEELLDDPSLRNRLGERAQERAATFSWQAVATKHHAAYRAVLTG